MSATPTPKVRPVTRWMVAYEGLDGSYFIGGSVWHTREDARSLVRGARVNGKKTRAIRVRITPVTPRKKAKKGAGR